jgi:hypothetical protein
MLKDWMLMELMYGYQFWMNVEENVSDCWILVAADSLETLVIYICVCVCVCACVWESNYRFNMVSCICAWNVQHIIFWLAGIATASGMVGLITDKLFYKTDQRSLSVHCICKRCYLWRLQIHDSENVNFRLDFSENYVRSVGLNFIAQFLSDVSAVGICKTIGLWASDS